MARSDWYMPKWKYYFDFVAVPVAAVLSVLTWGVTWWFPLQAYAGFVVWTLAEYLIHRLIFHGLEPYRHQHLLHHRDPREYVGVSPKGTVPALFALGLLLPAGYYVGLLAGYYTYIVMHDQFHHTPRDSAMARRHERHHNQWRVNFGVSTSLWDRVFGTFRA